jgi:hypothetical protein
LQEGETVVINPRAHEKKFRFPELPPLEAAPTELATTTAGLAPVEASQSAAHSASSQPASADASLHKDAATRTHHSPAPPPEKRPTVDAEVVSRVARWMSRFDINGDSKLSLEELARADRAARGKLQEADTNRDGLLDFRELTRLGDRLPDVPTATEEAGGGGG